MKVSSEFLALKKHKQLRAFLVQRKNENTYIRLCIEEVSKINNHVNTVFIETQTTVQINNCSYGLREVKNFSFHESIYNFNGDGHINTFLNAIKKDSEVSFYIVAFNGCNVWNEAGLVSHTLYGLIDNKKYLLSNYVGKDNTASPLNSIY
jgi:hypothetical protein